ncbi:kinase-like domain, phloem protein 2-like protein [Tanacetum coccineum]
MASGFEQLEIQLEEIKSATNNFNEANVIGHGGFGKVYKGELSQYSHSKERGMVAIKRLNRKLGQGEAEFHKEVKMLSCYRHENIISLLGFSSGRDDEMILVYEYASRGSLDVHLKDVNLTWTQRLKICLDAAKGLCYLHDPRETSQRLIHCDIKSANILLDDNFRAKVSDFGLSKICPAANPQNSILVTGALGTPGYCDPLFMETCLLTKESDVYSFGVVLFEVLCGKLCVEYSSKGQIKVIHVPMWKQSCEQKQLSEIVFQGITTEEMSPDSLETFADIAYKCLKILREERPAMSLVVEKLQKSLELQELYDLPKEYKQIVNAAVRPLKYRSLDEVKVLFFQGFHVNDGKTLLLQWEKPPRNAFSNSEKFLGGLPIGDALRLGTIFHHLSHKLSNKLLSFVDLYSGDIVPQNFLTLHVPSPFVMVIVIMFAVVGSLSSSWSYNLIH